MWRDNYLEGSLLSGSNDQFWGGINCLYLSDTEGVLVARQLLEGDRLSYKDWDLKINEKI